MASIPTSNDDNKLGSEGSQKVDVNPPAPSSYEEAPETPKKYPLRFWVIFASLSVTGLLAALESTVISTALPLISADLHSGELYIWFINVYFLTRYVQ
jgi:hypothetical protein